MKLLRRFRVKNSFQDAIKFIFSHEELTDNLNKKSWYIIKFN
jgi:hypothetical protein